MIRKIWLLLLSLFVIFGFGVSFANPIAPDIHYTCSKLKNVEIDNYRVIIPYMGTRGYSKFYEPSINECLNCREGGYGDILHPKPLEVEIFLLDKSIDIENVSKDLIGDIAISLGFIPTIKCGVNYDETKEYKIIKSGDTYKLEMLYTDYDSESSLSDIELESDIDILFSENKETNDFIIKQFFIARLMAIVVETAILFCISRLFRKEEKISNGKLILFGVLPTTITIPLLWFVLPLFVGEGTLYVIIGEILVTIIEAFIIKYGLKVVWGKAIFASIICNALSYGLGLLIL